MITFLVLAAIIFTLMLIGIVFGVGIVLVFLDWIVFGLVVYGIYKFVTRNKA
jgi:hypothetical protein